MNRQYILCLDQNYNVEISSNDRFAVMELEGLCDRLVEILKSYGVDDDEILYELEDDYNVELRKEDN